MATPRIAEQIGRVLGGRYRLMAPIGTGASAHVYVAEDIRLRRQVALKVLHPALAHDESFLRRFRAEAQAVAGLRHPHIMNVYDWGEDDDGPFLVLEHLSGGSLRDVLDTGHRLSVSQALAVGLEAARALDHAHRRGLVHRDIKPANLLFDDEGRLSIADFGLARALAEAAWTEPAGAVLGTARYASPEQARGSSVDGRSDVYALALTLIEAVTGVVPFTADTTIATLMARVDRPLEVPDALGPLAPVLAAAGTADPDERIDAGELARRLEAAASDLPRPARLPLVSSAPIDLTSHRGGGDDLTFLGEAASAASTGGRGAAGGATGARLFDVDREITPSAGAGGGAGRRGRRLATRIALALAVIMAMIGAGLAVASVTKPTFPVADLRGKTLADARRMVGGDADFEVLEAKGTFFREDVPEGRIIGQSPLPAERLKQGGSIRVQVSDGPPPRAVPDLADLTRADAVKLLDERGLVLDPREEFSETVPKETVIDWSPKGIEVPKGSAVVVVISKGQQPKPVPSLVEKLYDEAAKILEEMGFKPKKEEAFDDKVPEGAVVTTRPPPNEAVQPGSEVTVVVSKGPERVAVPDVSGKGISEAVAILEKAGFEVGGPYGPPNARRAYSTSPSAGTKVKKGSLVDLFVGR